MRFCRWARCAGPIWLASGDVARADQMATQGAAYCVPRYQRERWDFYLMQGVLGIWRVQGDIRKAQHRDALPSALGQTYAYAINSATVAVAQLPPLVMLRTLSRGIAESCRTQSEHPRNLQHLTAWQPVGSKGVAA